MKKNKFLSVLYITHNMDDFLAESLRSIWDVADEIIVVDNCSQDGTLDILNDLSSPKLKVYSKKFEEKDYREVVKAKRNMCLVVAQGQWLLFVDPDEIYKAKDLQWLYDTMRTTKKVHVRYKSLQFWRDFDHLIVGPHWDDTQERCLKNLPGLRYDKHAFSVSVNGEVLAKKYGKDFLDGIHWVKDECYIYHYGMCIHPEKIHRKLRNYMLSDNPVVNEANVEEFVSRHPYFSGNFDQPRHGPNGLWVAGYQTPDKKEKIVPFRGEHPETMRVRVEDFRRSGKPLWERDVPGERISKCETWSL